MTMLCLHCVKSYCCYHCYMSHDSTMTKMCSCDSTMMTTSLYRSSTMMFLYLSTSHHAMKSCSM